MGRNVNSAKLTKQYILSEVSQITIFSTYLNLSDAIIQNCIDSGELICSPIRDDVHPTVGFKYDNKGKLKYKDFSGVAWGDCFDIVAMVMSSMYNKEYDISNRDDFIKVLRHITFTFKDIFYGQEKDINMVNEINTAITNLKHKKPIIELVVREWNSNDINYWKQFGVPIKYLNLNFIYPIDQYYINRKVNPAPKYYYDSNDPCYAYILGKDRNGIYNIKLYFPYREKGHTKFISNCNHLEGIYNLDRTDYDIIVITKSTKDRVSIGAAMTRIMSLYGGVRCAQHNDSNIIKIGCINIPHETYRLRQNEYDWLKGKINPSGVIVSLMDNDRTGKKEAIWLKRNYNITPILIPKKYNAKDFAEFVMNNNFTTIYNIINNTINNIFSYDSRKNNKSSWDSSEWSNTLPY